MNDSEVSIGGTNRSKMAPYQDRKRKGSLILQLSFGLAISFAVLSLLAGLGSRLGWWDFRRGFSFLRIGWYGAAGTLLLTVFGIIKARKESFPKNWIWGIPPLLLSLILVIVPLNWLWIAKQAPRIHDITTDSENPPLFVAILPLRKEAPNPALYGGSPIAEQQKKGYPDLKPEMVPLDPDQTFQKALQTAEKMGWKIVEANPSERRIEATDTTWWFGFKDDIVIRILPVMGASRLDIRSLSRVGLSDVGTNAKRIRKFLKLFRES